MTFEDHEEIEELQIDEDELEMAEYIDRESMKQALRNAHIYLNGEDETVIEIEDIPAADVVSKAAYDQVAWERHLAEVQLKSIGKSLGEKMDDVQPVKHGRWLDSTYKYSEYNYDCSVCGCNEYRQVGKNGRYRAFKYCPECGADMRGVDNG